MRAICICAALLLASLSHAQQSSGIAEALKKIDSGLTLAEKSTSEIADYFESERARLTSESASLESERQRLSMESETLRRREADLLSQEKAIENSLKSLADREARAKRVGRLVRAAPAVAVVVFVAGVLAGRALK